jgi:predicted O-methyltransferase YrrM
VLRRYGAGVWRNLDFVLKDPEPHNFTYEITNFGEVASWVRDVTGADQDAALALVREPEQDDDLATRLRAATKGRWLWSKRNPPFGKRIGWYAIARALHPRLIVETGVHDGLGSMLLLRALERNAAEGCPGRLISFDINPAAGWLVGEHPRWQFRAQSSDDGLRELFADDSQIDMFIYDGWHSYDEERAELELVARHLSPTGVVLSDDAQVTGALADVCTAHGFSYFSVYTRPAGHFHPGTVLAAARRTL